MFITFEGVDGCGKSTQIRMLADSLREKGVDFIMLREPGSTAIGEQIREVLLSPENSKMSPLAEAHLYAAARIQLLDEVIAPALKAGKLVICDRYIDSSIAYQGFGRGLGADEVLKINSYARENFMPDLTLFLDIKPEDTVGRVAGRGSADRLELEGMDFKDRVYSGFMYCVENFKGRVFDIDASGTREETAAKISGLVFGKLK